MLLALLLSIFALCLYGIRFNLNGFNEDYLSKDNTNSIKGIFILLIVISHSIPYIARCGYGFDGTGDMLFMRFFSLLSQFPFQACLFPKADVLHANVICTLGIGFLAIWVIDEMWKVFMADGGQEEREGFYAVPWVRKAVFFIVSVSVVIGCCRLATMLRSDYGRGGVVLIVLLYCLRRFRIAALFISWLWMTWYNKFEIYAAPAFMLLACYNGKRGKQHKYFFYFFYPAHLLLIWLVRRHFFGY
jgi:hypothetical protein